MEKEISIIVPVFNEQENIEELNRRLISVLKEIHVSYEIIYIDDGSSDNSWKIISQLHEREKNVKGIRFSRNFGHQFALKSGLQHAKGNAVVSIDADLQHPPELIMEMYDKWIEGYEIVQAVRKDYEDAGFIKKAFSDIFYKIMNYLSELNIKPGSSDYRLLDRKVVEEINVLQETQFFLRGIVNWIGFSNIVIEYNENKRFKGGTKYSFKKMIRLAVDGIMSFSIKPLRLSTLLGFIFTFLAFVYLVYVLIIRLTVKQIDAGWASILGSVLLLGGIQLISIGIIGEYIGRIYIESKKRQNYVVEEKKF